ncbi:MAG: HaeII family restriction endonuclease [Snowella sp.]
MNIQEAKSALDKLIRIARVHFYKPIQIAEILYKDRVENNIDLNSLETYRNLSKKWRDDICLRFVGKISTSSARYQDDLFFNENAIPPKILSVLGKENKTKNGIVEAYIYRRFSERFNQMNTGLSYCINNNYCDFYLHQFLSLFRNEPGLKRSIDKIYEIVVYALFATLIEALEVNIEVSLNNEKTNILQEFEDFTKQLMNLDSTLLSLKFPAKIYRVGVTNAADKGLDMWANFGLAVQIKHLSLDEQMAQNIVNSISADRVVIVCKDSEEKIILSLLNQIGWKTRIQSIITESDLIRWYEKALRGRFCEQLGELLIKSIRDEIINEFPSTEPLEFRQFINIRGYDKFDNQTDNLWI